MQNSKLDTIYDEFCDSYCTPVNRLLSNAEKRQLKDPMIPVPIPVPVVKQRIPIDHGGLAKNFLPPLGKPPLDTTSTVVDPRDQKEHDMHIRGVYRKSLNASLKLGLDPNIYVDGYSLISQDDRDKLIRGHDKLKFLESELKKRKAVKTGRGAYGILFTFTPACDEESRLIKIMNNHIANLECMRDSYWLYNFEWRKDNSGLHSHLYIRLNGKRECNKYIKAIMECYWKKNEA